MINDQEGWAVGYLQDQLDKLLKTADGGRTWTDVSPPTDSGSVVSQIAAWEGIDFSHGWAMLGPADPVAPPPEAPVVWSTNDGGASWSASQPLGLPEVADFFIPGEIQFVDLQQGWIMVHLGAGMSHDYIGLYRTSDGGISWQLILDPLSASEIQGCQKTGMSFSSTGIGWLTLDCGGVVPGAGFHMSEDGGSTWIQISLPAPSGSPDLFTNAYCSTAAPIIFERAIGQLLVLCSSGSSGEIEENFVYRTPDGGRTWESHPFPGEEIDVIDSETFWAIGPSLSLTRDGGKTWVQTGTAPWSGEIDFIDIDTGWLSNHPDGEPRIARTDDSGESWVTLNTLLFTD
jgi:photosystem II stability/assembly factor-like uncharacterized protein